MLRNFPKDTGARRQRKWDSRAGSQVPKAKPSVSRPPSSVLETHVRITLWACEAQTVGLPRAGPDSSHSHF